MSSIGEDKVKEMAKMLLSGATMLAEQCPVCGAPLFRLKDNTVKCPSCGFVKEEKAIKKEEGPEHKVITEKEILTKKLESLLLSLEKTEDANETRTILEAIKIIHELLERT